MRCSFFLFCNFDANNATKVDKQQQFFYRTTCKKKVLKPFASHVFFCIFDTEKAQSNGRADDDEGTLIWQMPLGNRNTKSNGRADDDEGTFILQMPLGNRG